MKGCDSNLDEQGHDNSGSTNNTNSAMGTARSDESTASVMANNMRDNLDNGGAGLAVGEGVGSVGGLAAGAAIGSLAGPVGTVIGAIAGAVGGWWAGREVAETVEGYPTGADAHYRNRHESDSATTHGRFSSYDEARPLYQLGHVAAQNPDYAGRSFADVEPDLQRGWSSHMEQRYGSWNDVRGTVRSAYDAGYSKVSNTSNDVSAEISTST